MTDTYQLLAYELWEALEDPPPGFSKDVMLERLRFVHPIEQEAVEALHRIHVARHRLQVEDQDTPVQRIAREMKIETLASIALRHARAGVRPDLAWVEAIVAVYPEDKREVQLQHTCPKWAFSVLCQRGHLSGVRTGMCPAAEGKRSADFVLKALELLWADPSLWVRTQELKRNVFGLPSSPTFRRPNQEIEVLLALKKTGAITDELVSSRPSAG